LKHSLHSNSIPIVRDNLIIVGVFACHNGPTESLIHLPPHSVTLALFHQLAIQLGSGIVQPFIGLHIIHCALAYSYTTNLVEGIFLPDLILVPLLSDIQTIVLQ